MRYWKKKYLIALYDSDDELVTVLDNANELAEYLGTNANTAGTHLSRVYAGVKRSVYLNGRRLRVFLIDMSEEDEE